MVAIGRNPNTKDLNLEAAGVKTDDRGNIVVNEKLQTSADSIWAIGDCNGGPLFTHASWDDYRIIRDNVLHDAGRSTTDRIMPYTLFVDPELGRVGLTEQDARKKGLDILMAKIPASKVPRAVTSGEPQGLLKAVVDKQTKQILGCSLLCHSAGEVMSVVQMAMIGKVTYPQVANTIFTHPTMAESLNLLFATLP
jgi:pyruvate/2-oxoglutarate dehydrogenase complex dihydrolipoamide dehydrogenase (E3) component